METIYFPLDRFSDILCKQEKQSLSILFCVNQTKITHNIMKCNNIYVNRKPNNPIDLIFNREDSALEIRNGYIY